MANTIDPSLFLENNRQAQRKAPSNDLGKDEFLKILMVQLQNQDPLNPMEDKEFIAQMAQFSTLEQITNMSSSFAKFMEFQKSNVLASYVDWIGKEVDWEIVTQNFDEEGNELEPTIETGTGQIETVHVGANDVVELHLADGKVIYQDEVKSVKNQYNNAFENQLSMSSQMVGMMVSWLNKDDEQIDSIISSVHMKNGRIMYELNDGTLIKGEQIIKVTQNPANDVADSIEGEEQVPIAEPGENTEATEEANTETVVSNQEETTN
ncbi:MAG TPA: flagellar hook assembly protein FlgD [Bacillales bacterium]|nr:flagellar hook assembly protein FlgD [Bacillales bacterium]